MRTVRERAFQWQNVIARLSTAFSRHRPWHFLGVDRYKNLFHPSFLCFIVLLWARMAVCLGYIVPFRERPCPNMPFWHCATYSHSTSFSRSNVGVPMWLVTLTKVMSVSSFAFSLCFTLGDAALCSYLSFSSLSDRLSGVAFRREGRKFLRSIKEGLLHLHYYVRFYLSKSCAPVSDHATGALYSSISTTFDIYYDCSILSFEESEAASSIKPDYLIFASGRMRIMPV